MSLKKIDKLYIRVDINDIIATGHLMRCLAIADKAKEYNVETVFINADNEGTKIINDRGYTNIVLDTIWDNLNLETDKLIETIKENNIKVLLLDTYMVTNDYLKRIGKYTKTVYIDDLNEMDYNVDVLIAYCNYYQKFNYVERYKNVKLLLGTKYAPLRKEFSNLPKKKISEEIRNILVISGGTDNYHILEKILNNISDKYKITCICGRYNKDYDKLSEKYKNNSYVTLYKNVNNMVDYMEQADLVISAGGTTLYELCACGTPTITYSISDNQLDNTKSFNDEKIMLYAGDVRKDNVVVNIIELIDKYTHNFRKKSSKMMQEKVDGKGTERIVQELINN